MISVRLSKKTNIRFTLHASLDLLHSSCLTHDFHLPNRSFSEATDDPISFNTRLQLRSLQDRGAEQPCQEHQARLTCPLGTQSLLKECQIQFQTGVTMIGFLIISVLNNFEIRHD